MPVSLSSGLSNTLAQLNAQQALNAQYFQNANSFLDLGTRLDFLTQFADARNQGLTPTQALLGIQQTAANPLVSNLGLQNFQAQSAQLAPLAIGAATQGNPTLLNQLNASIGAPQLTGALPQENILSAISPFAGLAGTSALNAQFQQDRFLDQNSALIAQLSPLFDQARQSNQQIIDLQRQAGFNQVTPEPLRLTAPQQQQRVAQVQNILGFAPTASPSGTNGFNSLFGSFAF
jgi:hypothetical protein